MDTTNPVIRLCVSGSQAEFAGKPDDAYRLYWQAWEISQNDYEACIAAHYVARFQTTPEERLRWNQTALKRARRVEEGRVKSFYPSLYLNLGQAHEDLGNWAEAQRYYAMAALLGIAHQPE